MRTVLFNHKKTNDKGNRFSFAGVIDKEENTISIGVAKCSNKDQFDKEWGRTISYGRAIKKPLVVINIKNGNTPSYEFNNAVRNIDLSRLKIK